MTAFTRLSRVLAKSEEDMLFFECPGCDMLHGISHGPGNGPRWGWNGNVDKPTLTPSVLVRYHRYTPPADTLEMADKIRSGEVKQTRIEVVCHSFVTDGRIQFLSDCTHKLAGQTVDLPDWED